MKDCASKSLISSPSRLVALLSATYPCPYSNTPVRETLRLCIVMPWLLWTERLYARRSGICVREAMTTSFSSVDHSAGSIRILIPSGFLDPNAGNSTTGYGW